MARNLTINGERLWQSLETMARIGATPKGGVCRLALTDLDRESRDLFVSWCEEAGCAVRVDPMGNIFARREGNNPSLAPVATGSHLDTQPTGGRFDGAFGVLAGLEVIRTLNDHDVRTEAPIELVMWTNEEGARFAPAMVGSGVFAGTFDLQYGHSREDHEGKRMGDELQRIGYLGDAPLGSEFGAFFEAHIEQGPVLEGAERTIGVVSGVQGIRWYDIVLSGAECHAGPTPMDRRQDALAAAASLLQKIYALAHDNPPHGRATVGEFRAMPVSRNTVPGRVELSVDLRHPDAQTLTSMHEGLAAACERVARDTSVQVTLDSIWYSPPVEFDPSCVQAVRRGAELHGYSHMDVVSGAGHDAVYISNISPTAMVFIPCENGISHNEVENVTPEDAEAGTNVLLLAMLDKAAG